TKDFIYILNSRPQLQNQGPADALRSPSFRALLRGNGENSLTEAQYDVFMAPRPNEELYFVSSDPMQLNNIIGNREYRSDARKLRKTLKGWMENTEDNITENLTRDWYTRDAGKKIEQNFSIRGEMPGKALKADELIIRGKF